LTANEILWSDEGFKLGVDAMIDAHVKECCRGDRRGEPVELTDFAANIPMVLAGANTRDSEVIGNHRAGHDGFDEACSGSRYRSLGFVTVLAESDEEGRRRLRANA
jgi:hypothetical protein